MAPLLYGQDIRQHPDLLRRHGELRTSIRPPRSATSTNWRRCGAGRACPGCAVLHPTLVLAGDGDPIIPLVNGRVLARSLPNGRLHVVRGGGHLFLLLRAPFMAQLITGFLDEDRGLARA